MLIRLATLPARVSWAAVKAAASLVLDGVFGEPDDLGGYASTTTPTPYEDFAFDAQSLAAGYDPVAGSVILAARIAERRDCGGRR